MSDPQNQEYHQPVAKNGYMGLMSIWLIPILAIGIAGWLIIQSVLEQGPEISVLLQDAQGIEAGVTPIKYRDVTIGTVDRVEIPKDSEGVRAIISMQQMAKPYLTDTAQIWLVSPNIGLDGVSGLETLLSGAYLEIDPGEGGEPLKEFVGLATPPVITSSTPGREYILRAEKRGNVKRGTPILYKGLNVGKILGFHLSEDEQFVELLAFIEDPYTDMVQENTRFWDAGGVNVTVSTAGIEVGASSIPALLSGAIEFLPPVFARNSPTAKAGHEFWLFGSRQEMEDSTFTEKHPYLLYFGGSVSGLEVGANVEFKGIKIGTVRDINLEIHEETGEFFIPVLVDIEPQRLKVHRRSEALQKTIIGEKLRDKALAALIKRGLRARLKSSNFLTGSLIVDLDLFPDRPGQYVSTNTQYKQLPTLPTELEEITTSLTRLVEKIERLPIETLSESLVRTAKGIEGIIADGKFVETITEFRKLAVSVQGVIEDVDKETLPRINEAVVEGKNALGRVDKSLNAAKTLFETANSTLADGSPLKYDLSIMLRELSAASRSVRNLAEFLERNPSALIGGKR